MKLAGYVDKHRLIMGGNVVDIKCLPFLLDYHKTCR